MGAISFSLDQRLLNLLTSVLPLQTFVETGTFKGETLRLACPLFKECHSVELSPKLYRAAVKQFGGQAGVHLHHGPSPEFLRAKRDRFASVPTLFWLDAHWCVAEQTAGGESQTPLLAELEAIHALHPQSVLLIDDARLYLCPPPAPHRAGDWPDFHAVVQALLPLSRGHRLMVLNDVILFYPENLRAAVSAYAWEHGTDWLILAQDAREFRRPRDRRLKARLNRLVSRLNPFRRSR
jgi:hypothetical protein